MKGKILLVTGLGLGYVLGARAGRTRYEEIKGAASRFWSDPRVQDQVHTAEGYVLDKTPTVAGFVADGAKKVVSQVTRSGRSAMRSSSASSTSEK